MFYLKNWLLKLEKVAYNMNYTVYLDVYFILDTVEVLSSSLALTRTRLTHISFKSGKFTFMKRTRA